MTLQNPFTRIRRLREQNAKLFAHKIMLIIELETIATDPQSDQAREIIAKYRAKLDRRAEAERAQKN